MHPHNSLPSKQESNRLTGHFYPSARVSGQYPWGEIRSSVHSSLSQTRVNFHQPPPPVQPIPDSEPPKEITRQVELARVSGVDKCKRSRDLAVLGLLVISVLAFAMFGIGLHLTLVETPKTPQFLKGKTATIGLNTYVWNAGDEQYNRGHWAYSMSRAAVVLVPLLMNLLLTAAFGVMGFIDATVLRWSLWQDGRLSCHSNQRLFPTSKSHAPNSWYANTLSVLTLVSAYGSTAVLTTEIQVVGITDKTGLPINAKGFDGPHHGLDFNGWALLVLGVGIFIKLLLTTWGLLWDPELVKTWSTNPLVTARACNRYPSKCDRPDRDGNSRRSKKSVFAPIFAVFCCGRPSKENIGYPRQIVALSLSHSPTEDSVSSKRRQSNMRSSFKSVLRLTVALWLLVFLFVVATTIVAIVAVRSGRTSQSYVEFTSLNTNLSAYWQWYGLIDFPFVPNYYTLINDQRPWLGILIQSLFQAPLTLALHCTSFILSLVRDEHTWRRASSPAGGAVIEASTLIDPSLNWPAWLFFLYKVVVQWLFGSAIYTNQLVVGVSLIPLVALTGLLLMLGAGAELVTRRRSRSVLPPTWGNIDVLTKMVKDMDGEGFFWDDAQIRGGVGTATTD